MLWRCSGFIVIISFTFGNGWNWKLVSTVSLPPQNIQKYSKKCISSNRDWKVRECQLPWKSSWWQLHVDNVHVCSIGWKCWPNAWWSMTDLEQFDLSCPHAGANLKRGLPLENLFFMVGPFLNKKRNQELPLYLVDNGHVVNVPCRSWSVSNHLE